MARTTLSRCILLGVLMVIASTHSDCTVFAADATAATQTIKTSKAARGRLPPYYASVVNKEQREKIYSIQSEYRQKIEAARAQLTALTEEQQEKIFAVLSDEQKKQIEEIQSSAKAKRAEKAMVAVKAEKDPPIEKKNGGKREKSGDKTDKQCPEVGNRLLILTRWNGAKAIGAQFYMVAGFKLPRYSHLITQGNDARSPVLFKHEFVFACKPADCLHNDVARFTDGFYKLSKIHRSVFRQYLPNHSGGIANTRRTQIRRFSGHNATSHKMGNLLAGQSTQPRKIITNFRDITQGATLV